MTRDEFQQALIRTGLSTEEIAGRLRTSTLNVKRWLSGENAPTPMARTFIIGVLPTILDRIVEETSEE